MFKTSTLRFPYNNDTQKYFTAIAVGIFILGFTASIYAFYPGWMSVDSAVQYYEARHNHYSDWQPVLMAWWWSLLNKIYEGPALFLIQNVATYWTSLLILYFATRRIIGRTAVLFLLAGFIPGLLFPLGQIWKDVVFAVLLVLCFSNALRIDSLKKTPSWLERAFFFLALTLAYGVKTNGITAIPFVILYWIHAEQPIWSKLKKLGVTLCVTIGVVSLASVAVPQKNITRAYGMQYTQSYDLLAISVATKTNLLPDYINNKIKPLNKPLADYYYIGSNNLLFYNTAAGDLRTTNAQDADDLKEKWIAAIKAHPLTYIKHRTKVFASLLRIGEKTPAWVAQAKIVDTSIPFVFKANAFSDALKFTESSLPQFYYPWIYCLTLLLTLIFWRFLLPSLKAFYLTLQISAWAFVIPHFIITPASDYRYLYYMYFCAVVAVIISIGSVSMRLQKKLYSQT
ncbi:hypothetical protein KTQ42_08285|uniref:hypothetical protein n=1 Tax=Noviherbaspirillum sp. L7-7A TaxID=2850560 RepID=UPI001C2C0002|nr:hypothetical protein [Noviherbaspirillum sp. L7-7A]MBV0879299.1 hypothetical protein [Noviherbaspirillum sp. L7-7A]